MYDMFDLIRFIIYGGPLGKPDLNGPTRWHLAKCAVQHTYYPLKGRIVDWWEGETYVPLFCRIRGEMRAVRFSHAKKLVTPRNFALPEGVTSIDELPRFTTSNACFAHISETWPHLEP